MLGRTVMVAGLLLAAAGCACSNPRNTPLLTALDDSVTPGTTTAKVAWGPVFVPVGVTCGALDILVLHPTHALKLGAEDTYGVLWKDPAGTPAEQTVAFLPKAVATPVVFTFCWLGESAFDLRPRKDARTE
jgi:hypothetical protein